MIKGDGKYQPLTSILIQTHVYAWARTGAHRQDERENVALSVMDSVLLSEYTSQCAVIKHAQFHPHAFTYTN